MRNNAQVGKADAFSISKRSSFNISQYVFSIGGVRIPQAPVKIGSSMEGLVEPYSAVVKAFASFNGMAPLCPTLRCVVHTRLFPRCTQISSIRGAFRSSSTWMPGLPSRSTRKHTALRRTYWNRAGTRYGRLNRQNCCITKRTVYYIIPYYAGESVAACPPRDNVCEG